MITSEREREENTCGNRNVLIKPKVEWHFWESVAVVTFVDIIVFVAIVVVVVIYVIVVVVVAVAVVVNFIVNVGDGDVQQRKIIFTEAVFARTNELSGPKTISLCLISEAQKILNGGGHGSIILLTRFVISVESAPILTSCKHSLSQPLPLIFLLRCVKKKERKKENIVWWIEEWEQEWWKITLKRQTEKDKNKNESERERMIRGDFVKKVLS